MFKGLFQVKVSTGESTGESRGIPVILGEIYYMSPIFPGEDRYPP